MADGADKTMTGTTADVTELTRAEAALRDNEARLRLVQQAGGIGSFYWDIVRSMIYRSPEYLALHGLPADWPLVEAFSESWRDRVHPDDRAMVEAFVARDLANPGPFEHEYRIVRVDTGETRWLINRGIVEADAAGKPIRLLSAQTDVTARKAIEHELRASDTRFRALVETVTTVIWLTDGQGRIVAENPAWQRFTGQSFEQYRGWGWNKAVHPDDIVILSRTFEPAQRNVAGYRCEYRLRRADGEYRLMRADGAPIVGADGRATEWVCANTDLTDARRAEDALRESEARFRDQFENANDYIFTTDLEMRITSGNPAVAAALGRPLDELIGHSISDFTPAEVWTRNRAMLAAKLDGSAEATRYEVEVFKPGGGTMTWEINSRLIRDVNGAPTGLHAIARDTSARNAAEQALRESEERFRLIADSAPVPIWVTKLDRNRGFVNRAYLEFLGVEYEEALVFDWRSVIHPDDVERVVAESIAGEASLAPFVLEGRYRGANGDWRWLRSESQPRWDADGNHAGFIGVAHDITEAKRAEAALRESAAELRVITDALPVLVSYIDAGRRYRFTNKTYTDWFGQPRETIIGRHMREVLGAAAYAATEPRVDRALAGGHVTFEARVPYKDGGARDVLVEYIPHVSDGAVPGFYAMVQDIGERKASEEALRRSEEQFRTLADNMSQFAWTADATGWIYWYNKRWHDYTGTTLEEMQGWGWRDVHHPDHVDRVVARLQHSWDTGEVWEDTFPLRGKDGGYRWFLSRAEPIRDESGAILRWFGTNTDITEQLAAEERLRELNDTLEIRVGEEIGERMAVEESLRQAQKMEAIGQLTGGIAHDFNNLLTVIIGSVDLLRRPGLADEKRARYIDAIGDTANRAAALTNQLLAFARRQPLASEAFDAAASVNAMQPMLHTMLGAGIRLDISAEGDGLIIKADPNQFEAALLNMAANARDAMPNGGTLTISLGTDPERDCVRVRVADTGSGIDAETLASIFEPFYTTKAVGKGTGLGLSQVYGFARQSEGSIDVASTPGEGTTFTLCLPRGELRAVEAAATAETVAVPARSARVLVVEDNRDVGEFAARLLEDMGHEVTLAEDGESALARIRAAPRSFDLVFSDVIMPGAIDGLALARALRDECPDLPVVLTTGYSHGLAVDPAHGFEVLRKPYRADALAALIARATRAMA